MFTVTWNLKLRITDVGKNLFPADVKNAVCRY